MDEYACKDGFFRAVEDPYTHNRKMLKESEIMQMMQYGYGRWMETFDSYEDAEKWVNKQ